MPPPGGNKDSQFQSALSKQLLFMCLFIAALTGK